MIGNNDEFIKSTIQKLSQEFAVKDLGRLHYFLSLEIKYITDGIFITQTKYIKDILARSKMDECSHFATPMAIKQQFTTHDKK